MMFRTRKSWAGAVLALALLAAPLAAQNPAGHWDGAIMLPNVELAVEVDLAREDGVWTGDISIPQQGATDLPLTGIAVAGASVSFGIQGVQGDPRFDGELSADGATMTGTFHQAGQQFPFELTRTAGPPSAEAEEPAAEAEEPAVEAVEVEPEPEPAAPGEEPEPSVQEAQDPLEGWDAWLEQAMEDWQVPGLALAVVRGGDVVLMKGYGLRDREKGLPVTEHTLFAIGSSTKAFTTFAMGRLVDAGELDFDDPVVTYLPELRLEDEYATLHLTPRDMVTHRSGLPRHDLAWYNSEMGASELLERMRYFPPNRELREEFQYNNMMFVLAGHLVARLTGRSWEDAITEWVLDPLGMDETNFSVEAMAKAPDRATGYGFRADTLWRMPYRDITNVGPAGSVNSNIDDMARWVRMHLGGGTFEGERLLAEGTLRELHTPQMVIGALPTEEELGPTSYAMGWFVDTYRGHLRVHHGGNIDGFSALVTLFPRDEVGVVILTNRNGSALPGLAVRHLADRLFGLERRDWNAEALERREQAEGLEQESEERVAGARIQGTSPSHDLADYAGSFGHPGYGTLQVRLEGGGLVLEYNRITAPLEHWHYDVFNALENPADPTFEDAKLRFRTNLDGEIDAVLVPVEPTLEPLVFERQPDAELSDPSYLERFVGTYELGPQTITVSLRGDRLAVTVTGQPTLELEPLWSDRFAIAGLEGYRVAFTTVKGRVTEAVFHQPNGIFPAERVEPEG